MRRAQAGRQGDALSAPLSVALAQLVALEMTQAEQLADTRAAIAAIEKLSPPPVAAPAETPMRSDPAPAAAATRRPRPAAPPRALVKGHAGTAAAAARALALLRLMAAGPRTAADLRAELPVPAGASDHQHRQSVGNALTRLRADGCIVIRTDGWALTAKGRARAAKEAP